MAVAARSPLVSAVRSSSVREQEKRKEEGGVMGNVLRVVRRDTEFLTRRFQSVSKALGDLFWLRNLEDPRALHASRPPAHWSKIFHPPGLWGVDLMMADLQALKVYADYIQLASRIWSVPLPDLYDPQKVSDYFNCRPHVLAFRIIEVISSFAFASIKMQMSRSFNLSRHGVSRDDSLYTSEYYIGLLLKESFLNLGPTFIKVGQSLSTRPDVIGSEISKALSELHDKIPPFPRAVAMKIIEEELGCPVDSMFSYISDEPVAAASFGQVYQVCTLDGSVVAVKVQRPDLLHVIMRDIYILRLGLTFLRKVAKRRSDLSLYADELGKGLVGELDYMKEAANASEFLEAHSQYSFISVPKVIKKLTRKRVLTMEWMIGENPNNLLLLSGGFGQGGKQYSEKIKLEAKRCILDLVDELTFKGLAIEKYLEDQLRDAKAEVGNTESELKQLKTKISHSEKEQKKKLQNAQLSSLKIADQIIDNGLCVTYISKGRSENFVKMVQNEIEYDDMQLMVETYDVLKSVGKLSKH